jgi:hypothetical protein
MKTLALGLALALLAPSSIALAEDGQPPIPIVATSDSAPADRYFGPYHLSVLGMRNALRDLARYAPADAARVYPKLVAVEDAVLDWKTTFPADPWLPALGLRLGKLFDRLGVADSAQQAQDTYAWVIAEYPDSDEAIVAAHLREPAPDAAADPSVPIVDPTPNPPMLALPAAPPSPPVADATAAPAPTPTPRPSAVNGPGSNVDNATVPITAAVIVGTAAWLLLHHRH